MINTIEIEKLKEQFVKLYSPKKIILFGSQAKGTAKKNSDIDICVVIDSENKRKTLVDMYVNIESEKPYDLLLYTPDEWNTCVEDDTSFAHLINRKGVVLYG